MIAGLPWRLGTLLVLGALVLCLRPAPAGACTVDGVPSLTVNGYTVVVNKTPPVGPNLQVWAPFVLPFSIHTGRDEVLAEINQRVALTAEAFKNPWRWNFGDGAPPVRGTSVHHVYHTPGTYKITVDAYFPSHHFWYTFDAVQIHVLHG